MSEVRQNNVFRNGRIVEISSTEKLLVREKFETVGTVEDRWHLVKTTDRLDVLAWKYYGSRYDDASKFWWVIADANNIMNPLDLSELVGKEILVPEITRVLLNL
jgi:hypothetical protein